VIRPTKAVPAFSAVDAALTGAGKPFGDFARETTYAAV